MSVKTCPAGYGQLNIMSKPSSSSSSSCIDDASDWFDDDQLGRGVFHTADMVDAMCCGSSSMEPEKRDDDNSAVMKQQHKNESCLSSIPMMRTSAAYNDDDDDDENDMAVLAAKVKLSALLMNIKGTDNLLMDDVNSLLTETEKAIETNHVPLAKDAREQKLPFKFVVLQRDLSRENKAKRVNSLPAVSSIGLL